MCLHCSGSQYIMEESNKNLNIEIRANRPHPVSNAYRGVRATTLCRQLAVNQGGRGYCG